MEEALKKAARTPLEFSGDCLVFTFSAKSGEEWEGVIDEWLGNDPDQYSLEPLSLEGRNYIELGSSGGGADKVLLRDDGVLCYLNDMDQSISEVARTLEEFISLLRPPEDAD